MGKSIKPEKIVTDIRIKYYPMDAHHRMEGKGWEVMREEQMCKKCAELFRAALARALEGRGEV